MKKLLLMIMILFLSTPCFSISAYADNAELDYKEIKGVTQNEVDAIEAIKKNHKSLSYGALHSTEAFIDEQGRMLGFVPNFCNLLSELFGIKFVPELKDWDEIVDGLEDKTIDFSGELTITPERLNVYYMSEPIAVRSISMYYLEGKELISEIIESREPIFGFLTGTMHESQLNERYEGKFTSVYLDTVQEVTDALESGEIDAFITDGVAEPAFDFGIKVKSDVFSPLICNSVSLTTQNEELAAIISVLNKYIASGAQTELSTQYELGMTEYERFVMRKEFTEEEKAYIDKHIASGEKIPIILESGNYPISFYNEKSAEYQGIVPDILDQVSVLTGLQFESINGPEEDWLTVLGKVESGEAKIISELLHTESREGLFLWPDEPSSSTNYALLSRSDYPAIGTYQLLGKRIGVEIDTAYQDIAQQWFPDVELILYNSLDEAFSGLDSGDIDLIMASENMLLSQTNYNEKPGYKVNFTIDYTADSKLGFNIEEDVLLSIFNKTFEFVENDDIVRDWQTRVFDYSAQLSKNRLQMMMIAAALLIAFIILLVVFLFKNQGHRRTLASTVKARTAQLEEKTATLSTVYNTIPDLLYLKDSNGKYVACNPSFELYAGKTEDEIRGKKMSEIFSGMNPELIASEDAQDFDVIQSDSIEVVEQKITYPDGEERLIETIKAPVRQNGTVKGMLGISRDITAHREAEEAALEASKAKGDFLARMSHEIRTPLNAIMGMSEIIKVSAGDQRKTISSADQIMVSSKHLLGLINDVLDMSKIESGKLEIVESPFKLQSAFEETLTIASERCDEKNIVFSNNVSELPDITVDGDKLRINQVMINLLSNAIKFTDLQGRIGFSIDTITETSENITLRFSVKDDGIGMSSDQVARLFRPFEQADKTISTRFGGTGLGLSISQSLVEQMGGKISIDSSLGSGSEFSFVIQLKKVEDIQTDTTEENDTPDFSASRILLAEDIEINHMILSELLSPTNICMDWAINGEEVVKMFEEAEPGYYQLIFMDIQMPEKNGYEATAEIRSMSRNDAKEIPIIAMTANAYKEDVAQAIATGMNGHIGKPIEIAEVIKTLSAYLS